MESGPLFLCLHLNIVCVADFMDLTSVSNVCEAAPISRTLRSNDADGNENVKKSIRFLSKTTTLDVHHTCSYISFPGFARLPRENAYFRVLWRR